MGEYDPEVSASVEEEQYITYDAAFKWSMVGETNPPPKRQSHSAVIYNDSMYIFGGERSAYQYGDLWKYDFEDDEWHFQAPFNSSSELPRHDHSSVVFGDHMFVYGGRNPIPLGDMWVYSFLNATWSPAHVAEGLGPRFAHSAAVSDGVMYIYGGYVVHSGQGHLTSDIWSYEFSTATWTKLGPRESNFASTWSSTPAMAINFPSSLPDARSAQASVLTGSRPALYVIGGLGGPYMVEKQEDLWKFDLESLEWTLMGTNSLLGRYDSQAVLYGDGRFAFVFGGQAEGKIFGDAFLIFLGETG